MRSAISLTPHTLACLKPNRKSSGRTHDFEMLRRDSLRRLARRALVGPTLGRRVLLPAVQSGYRRYLRTGETPTWAYRAMRTLYGNRDESLFRIIVSETRRHAGGAQLGSAVTGLVAEEIENAVEAIEENGFYVLIAKLTEASCQDLEDVARSAQCSVITSQSDRQQVAVYDESAPIGVRYDLDEVDILRSKAAQRLVADESILCVAARYLHTIPVQDLVAMWWSVAKGPEASSVAAQRFHFDLDRTAFLKFFVYLTNVDETTGPHVYVRGSHHHRPFELREDRRFSDEEVDRCFPGQSVLITGPRGTAFFADTRGLHKGLNLQRSQRLVFQLEYANSLFGQRFTQPTVVEPIPSLIEMKDRYLRTFTRFHTDVASP